VSLLSLARLAVRRIKRCSRRRSGSATRTDIGYRRLKRLVVLPVLCAICGELITHVGHDGASHTFDHITPWSEAPSNDP
jgi:hypothetical protein